MNAHTHILGGLVVAGLALSVGMPHPVTLVAASGFGGLVPDWDHPHSTIGRWIPWPSVSQSRGPHAPPAVGRAGYPHAIWHRHQAHSLVAVGVASGILALLGDLTWGLVQHASHGIFSGLSYPFWWVLVGLIFGGISHLLLDGFNQTPQWWLWPFSRRGFRWPIHGSVRRTDSRAFLILMGLVVLLGWHLVGLRVSPHLAALRGH